MKRIITLVGFMGTGKSTVGRILAARLGYKLVDVDHEIENEQGVTISQIFSDLGEPYFRMLERDMIKSLSSKEKLVVSAGGGAVIDPKNVEHMKMGGPVVCLTATPEEIFRRVGGSKHRPLLQAPDPMARIVELLAAREQYYMRADIVIDTSGLKPDKVADNILEKVRGIL